MQAWKPSGHSNGEFLSSGNSPSIFPFVPKYHWLKCFSCWGVERKWILQSLCLLVQAEDNHNCQAVLCSCYNLKNHSVWEWLSIFLLLFIHREKPASSSFSQFRRKETGKWGHELFQPQQDHRTPIKQQPIQWITTSSGHNSGSGWSKWKLAKGLLCWTGSQSPVHCLFSLEAFSSKSRFAGILVSLDTVESLDPPAACLQPHCGAAFRTESVEPPLVTVQTWCHSHKLPYPGFVSFIPSTAGIHSKRAGSVAPCAEC